MKLRWLKWVFELIITSLWLILVLIVLFSLCIVVYVNPTLSQAPVCSIPRGSVVAVDEYVISAEGPWVHVFDMGGGASLSSPDGSQL